jgi:peroxiredoxin family protein
LNDLLEMLQKHLDQPVQKLFGTDRAVVFLVVLDACRVQRARGDFDGLQALEPCANETPRKYKVLYSCSRETKASDGPSGSNGPFVTAMCNREFGFFAEGVALRDAIESVSQAVLSSAGGQAPTILGRPDALPSDFCINPRSGAGGSGGAGKRKEREADEEWFAVLREMGMENDVHWLANRGVYCREDMESLREGDLEKLGFRFRKLLDHVKSFQAQTDPTLASDPASAGPDSVLSKMNEMAKRGHVPAIIKEMLNHASNRRVQIRGCQVLADLVASNADKRVEVAEESGIGAILLAMRGHPASAKVQAAGCQALQNLTVNGDNEVKVKSEGGIGAMKLLTTEEINAMTVC